MVGTSPTRIPCRRHRRATDCICCGDRMIRTRLVYWVCGGMGSEKGGRDRFLPLFEELIRCLLVPGCVLMRVT